MWPRVAEILLAAWLAISPMALSNDQPDSWISINHWISAAVVFTLSGISFLPRLSRAHLGNLAVSLWLVGWSWFVANPAGPAAIVQNALTVGLTLAMFAILPSQASRPPRGWREWTTSTT